ncbi:MAG: substrate-binding domain-containing protein [Anaerolineae bacterium]|nr:substrate-binding domain-containing protein [Anaerolineae bacterium]
MRRQKLVLVIVVLLALLAVTIGVAAQEGEPLKIGLLTDQSGPLTIYGIEQENGFLLGLLYAAGIDPTEYDSLEAALADVVIAGRPVEVIVRDNGSNPDTAASQARELIEQEGVEILVGAPSSGVMTGVQQVALDSDVLVFAAPAASPAITGANFNPNTFRVCRNSLMDFLAFAPYASTELGSNFVIFAIDNDFGRTGAAGAKAVFSGAGIEFPFEDIYVPLETTDFTPYLQQVLNSGADVVLPIWAGDTSVTLFQQMAELGVGEQMAIVTAFNSNDIVATLDPSSIGFQAWIVYHYTFPETEINDWLVEKHQAVYNDWPDLFTECSFATAQAIAGALEATSGNTLPEAMIPALEGMVFEGPKGTYYIRPSDHQTIMPMYVAQLDNLDDPDQRFYTLLSEIPPQQVVPPVMLPEAYADRVAMDEEFMANLMAGS